MLPFIVAADLYQDGRVLPTLAVRARGHEQVGGRGGYLNLLSRRHVQEVHPSLAGGGTSGAAERSSDEKKVKKQPKRETQQQIQEKGEEIRRKGRGGRGALAEEGHHWLWNSCNKKKRETKKEERPEEIRKKGRGCRALTEESHHVLLVGCGIASASLAVLSTVRWALL